jgi:iron-sulfur cluster repair protein YtfE (RIC family)
MQHKNYDEQTVKEVAERVPEARHVLRSYHISASNAMPLDIAAAEASVTPDELLAVVEYTARRRARQAPAIREYAQEEELVA